MLNSSELVLVKGNRLAKEELRGNERRCSANDLRENEPRRVLRPNTCKGI